MRKSSRGNPYHDERGRFTSAGGTRSHERNYEARNRAIEAGTYDRESARNLCRLRSGGKLGEWEVRRNGDDFEVYKDGEPAFQRKNGRVKVHEGYEAYADDFAPPKKTMPWEEGRYKHDKNGKLMWLMDHPESKYNDPEFVGGIKKIERMADMGVPVERRRASFSALCRAFDMTEEEGRHFILPMFIE